MVVDNNRSESAPIWHKAAAQRSPGTRRLLVLVAVVIGYALTVLVFYPGYVTVDARYVYADAQAWQLGDWQSPVMGALWRLIDSLAPGPLSMFLLPVTVYWLRLGSPPLIRPRRLPRLRPRAGHPPLSLPG